MLKKVEAIVDRSKIWTKMPADAVFRRTGQRASRSCKVHIGRQAGKHLTNGNESDLLAAVSTCLRLCEWVVCCEEVTGRVRSECAVGAEIT
jgi:hypothetical protein